MSLRNPAASRQLQVRWCLAAQPVGGRTRSLQKTRQQDHPPSQAELAGQPTAVLPWAVALAAAAAARRGQRESAAGIVLHQLPHLLLEPS